LLKKQLLVLFAAMVLLLMLTACGKDDVSVVGVWERQIDEFIVRLNFNADESFILQVGERSRTISGNYDVRGNVILFVDDDCGEIEGKYRVGVHGNTATFIVLNDECEGRVEVVNGEWQGTGNQ
jgi:hypothetical protein